MDTIWKEYIIAGWTALLQIIPKLWAIFLVVVVFLIVIGFLFFYNLSDVIEKFKKSKSILSDFYTFKSKKAQYLIMVICLIIISLVMAGLALPASLVVKKSNELIIDNFGDKIYPIGVDIKDETTVGDWTYFRYYVTDEEYGATYPALFRYRNDTLIAERISEAACYSFDVAASSVFYMDSTWSFQDHGILYVSRPDGKNERLLEDELYDFQIVDGQYIYYVFRHDTLGVGLEGHALYRMNLDGSQKMIVTYEVKGIDASGQAFGISHFDYIGHIEDGWLDCVTFKIELNSPSVGMNRVISKNSTDNDWIYYTTNRLLKAKNDGTEIIELDGEDDYRYDIKSIDGDWIYYIKGQNHMKIKNDGTSKQVGW